jgi:hypothetical protein
MMLLLGLPRDRYVANPLARWLLPSNRKHSSYCCVQVGRGAVIEPLSSNDLRKSVTILTCSYISNLIRNKVYSEVDYYKYGYHDRALRELTIVHPSLPEIISSFSNDFALLSCISRCVRQHLESISLRIFPTRQINCVPQSTFLLLTVYLQFIHWLSFVIILCVFFCLSRGFSPNSRRLRGTKLSCHPICTLLISILNIQLINI